MEESVLGMGQKESARSVATKGATPQPGVEDSAIYTGRIAKRAASNDETWSIIHCAPAMPTNLEPYVLEAT